MTCEHKRLKHGYEKTYDVQWCLDCGVITHSSDGLIGPGLHKRTDWSNWINVNLEAWSCRNEAHDGKRCSHWCGGATCPASIRSVATTTQNDSIQPAHRALLRQYESITDLESRLAAATDRITTLTEERDSARAEAAAMRADAERYRALKPLLDSADFAYGDPPRSVIVFAWDRPVSADLDAMLDAAIDAARGADHD